jgi:hypothetical protein
MKRTTRAIARLGTLAVIAGTALGTPLAIGTASAAVTAVTTANGTIGSLEDAAAQATYPNIGTVTWTAGAVNSTLTLAGSNAYFPATAQQPANITVTSKTTATCTIAGPCTARVGDASAESVSVFIADVSDATSVTATVNFNGIFITGCPQSGLDYPVPVAYGTPAQVTPANCVTQGQFGQTLTLSGKYLAGGQGVSQGLVVTVGAGNMRTGPDTSTCTATSTTNFNCTSDASGNFTYTFTNAGVGNPPAAETNANYYYINTRNSTGSYPPIVSLQAPPAPVEYVNWGVGGVTPARVNVTGVQVIVPNNQDTANSSLAEPGDVIQQTFQVRGSCTPAGTDQNCDNGTLLAGIPVTVTVDHGFITPNCTKGGVTAYAECSFATTPAKDTKVGDLTDSGKSATVNTGIDGTFKVSFGIKRDAAFDQAGVVPIHVTVAELPTLRPGILAAGISCDNPMYIVPKIPGGVAPAITVGVNKIGCTQDAGWTTAEQPLNGGTAKFKVIPSLAQPSNTAIQTENNFTADTTKAWDVPDVDRVVFEFLVTDQFDNLTQFASPKAPQLTKTGVGAVFACGGFSSTNACTAGGAFGTQTAQQDGTVTQVGPVFGSYLANIPGAFGQMRYQADTTTPSAPGAMNQAWPCVAGGPGACVALPSANPGVNDGTQKDVLSWSPPTTTFASYIAGSPAIATYAAGTGTAQTETLTLNFYNQLAEAVVTFAARPGTNVQTGTAVTVEATVKDQHGNPIVNQTIDAVRSGANESTCVPQQNVGNGGNVTNPLFTNTSGQAGYTFTCTGAGVSTVSMVVLGPGGTQLAQGNEAVTFTGGNINGGQKVEKPTFRITAPKRHVLVLHAATHPSLSHVTVHFYKVKHGLKHLIGADKTGPAGHARLKVKHLKSGTHPRYTARVVNLTNKYKSKYAKSKRHVVR